MKESEKILCIGDLILDHYVHGDIDRISPEAPIPILKANDKNYNILGGCGNVARNICSANNKNSVPRFGGPGRLVLIR